MSKLVCLRNFPVSGDRVLFSSNLIYSIFRSLPANFKMFLCFRNMSYAGLGIRSFSLLLFALVSPLKRVTGANRSRALFTKRVTRENRSCCSVQKELQKQIALVSLYVKCDESDSLTSLFLPKERITLVAFYKKSKKLFTLLKRAIGSFHPAFPLFKGTSLCSFK